MQKSTESTKTDEKTESLVIDSRNPKILQKLWNNGEFDTYFNSVTHWTRITIIKGKFFDKDLILRTLFNNVYPLEIIPALYSIDGHDSFFLLRNCNIIIKKLSWLNLKLQTPDGNIEFDVRIITNYLPFSLEGLNPLVQIQKALDERYCLDAATLDLTNFSQDKWLKGLYFHLNIPQCMNMILEHLLKTTDFSKLCTLILQHNDLSSLETLILKWNGFIELDLRNNNITWEGFFKLKIKNGLKITRIWLDGNPMCVGLSEADYIKKIMDLIPTVGKVDGIDVSKLCFGRPIIKNYLRDCSWSGFVDHFLHHYFGLFESTSSFKELIRMYHDDSTFSYTAIHNPEGDQMTDWNRLSDYKVQSRNLLTISDVNKTYSTMNVGPDEIIKTLKTFPLTQSSRSSLKVDVPITKIDEMVLINVSGVFKDHTSLFNFNRSFVLTPYRKNFGEWKIQNDMLTIVPMSPVGVKNDYVFDRLRLTNEMRLKLNPIIKTSHVLLPVVCKLTKLTEEWAERFLRESSWNLEMTLQAFTDQLKSNQIPLIAFTI